MHAYSGGQESRSRRTFPSKTALFLFIVLSLTFCTTIDEAAGQSTANSEVYTITGAEFISEMTRQGYDLKLFLVNKGSAFKNLPLYNKSAPCWLARNAELTLNAAKLNDIATTCRLKGFTNSDNLAPGWKIENIQWRGDHKSVHFLKDPVSTNEPLFAIDLLKSHRANVAITKIRLVIVRLSGPSGAIWKDAFR